MTDLLQQALTEVGKSPATEQDAIAAIILEELAEPLASGRSRSRIRKISLCNSPPKLGPTFTSTA